MLSSTQTLVVPAPLIPSSSDDDSMQTHAPIRPTKHQAMRKKARMTSDAKQLAATLNRNPTRAARTTKSMADAKNSNPPSDEDNGILSGCDERDTTAAGAPEVISFSCAQVDAEEAAPIVASSVAAEPTVSRDQPVTRTVKETFEGGVLTKREVVEVFGPPERAVDGEAVKRPSSPPVGGALNPVPEPESKRKAHVAKPPPKRKAPSAGGRVSERNLGKIPTDYADRVDSREASDEDRTLPNYGFGGRAQSKHRRSFDDKVELTIDGQKRMFAYVRIKGPADPVERSAIESLLALSQYD